MDQAGSDRGISVRDVFVDGTSRGFFTEDHDEHHSHGEGTDEDSEGEKIVAMVRDGRCVTMRLEMREPDAHTFLGHDVEDMTPDQLVIALKDQGINAVVQYNGVALPDHFVVIEPGDSITWWDPNYWGLDGFLESAVAMPQSS